MKMGTPGPHFPGKLGTPLGKQGPPVSSAARLFRECSLPKSRPFYIEPVLQKWKKVSSCIFHKKSRLENNTSEQGRLKSVATFPMVATPMVVLYQVRLDSYIALRMLRTKYFCARDGDNFCVGDHQVKLLALL